MGNTIKIQRPREIRHKTFGIVATIIATKGALKLIKTKISANRSSMGNTSPLLP
jgi:hypothetical protein